MFKEKLLEQISFLPASVSSDGANFFRQNLPTKKDESWKYTDLSFLNTEPLAIDLQKTYLHFDISEAAQEVIVKIKLGNKATLPTTQGFSVMEGGSLRQKLKDDGVSLTLLNKTWQEQNYFSRLSESTVTSDVYILFDQQWSTEKIFQLQWQGSTAALAQFGSMRVSLVVADGVSVQLHETFNGNANSFLNTTTDLYIGANASVHLLKSQPQQSPRTTITTRVRLGQASQFYMVSFISENMWSRHNTYVDLSGREAHADLKASFLCREKEFVDHHTYIDHSVGYTTSRQDYAGVLDGRGEGVFNGKVHIRRDAQKSDAEQLSRNLLLSKNAVANAKPELLIDADDVKAKHGATIGQLDQEEIFYMQSRGLTAQQARALVIKSFVFSAADHLPNALAQKFYALAAPAVQNFTEKPS
ncbi:MAG: Fe-S cluster assembly protein SufD [Bdellovibrionaceae bacterium]|nr:Fe-S cluster assembly protein SufD [Pseudobdellovibrionaceae bacterium]